MFTKLDENSYYLIEYEKQQDALEKEYLTSLDQKIHEVEFLASEILKMYVEDDVFYEAFKEYWDESSQKYSPFLIETLNDWSMMQLQEEDVILMQTFARLALETACEIIMGDSLYSVSHDGAWSVSRMIRDLIGEV